LSQKYWLDLFTGKTWEEFLNNGATITGFRERRRKSAEKIKPGDYFICYVTGISRFIGVLEILSEVYFDKSSIWEDEEFPIRFKVKLLYQLDPETAIPISSFKDKLSIFKHQKTSKGWTGFFRGSPTEFKSNDGEIVFAAIKEAVANPIKREFEEKKYWRKPRKTYKTKFGEKVTIPEAEREEKAEEEIEEKATHEEIQYMLLNLGSKMGLDVWVAKNDLNKEFNGSLFRDISNLRQELPRQFDEATNRTIELIDVLWLQGDAIIAAFEVEHTTAIYSGLLRMSDLVTMQPNIKLDLYLVAPDEKRDKVFNEINRPTFAKLKPPLPKIRRFIPYSKLRKEIRQLGDKIQYIKPEFLNEISEKMAD
jgi:predicted RNA-binding protein